MAYIGSILRETRIHLGLTLKQVSEITKVRAKYLQALEEDDYEILPGPTFIKAYLRTYASMLRLDPDAVIEEYRNTYERRQVADEDYYDLTLEQMRTRASGRRRKRSPENTRRGYALAGALAIIAVVLLAWFGSNRGSGEVRLGSESFGDGTSTNVSAVSSTTTTLGPATTDTTAAVVTGNDIVLGLKATADCYVVVRVNDQNGEVEFRGVMLSGDAKLITGAKRYWLQIGEPESLQVSINDIVREVTGGSGIYYATETGMEKIQ